MNSSMSTLSRLRVARDVRDKGSPVYFPLSVSQDKLYVKLKSSKEKYPVVSGFDKDENGLAGEVEASGTVRYGDYLKSVNGISLYNRPFKQCISIIRRECQFDGPKELTFFRYEKVAKEVSGWQAKSPVYNTYSAKVLTALHERTQLDMYIVREFSKLGLPDDGGVRSILWKVLLGFLPPEADTWDDVLAKSHASYQDLLAELIVEPWSKENPQPLKYKSSKAGYRTCNTTQKGPNDDGLGAAKLAKTPSQLFQSPISSPSLKSKNAAEGQLLAFLLSGGIFDEENSIEGRTCPPLSANPVKMNAIPAFQVYDHPLNMTEGSAWKGYWDDWLLCESIEKDVIRTHPCLHFFAEESGIHHTALKRILYLYAKLNPGIKYVQGMNELVGTLYYVFGNNMSYEPWREHVEADTFFCFSLLMIDVRDLFIRNLDDASCGIGGRIQDFVDTLFAHDKDVALVLEKQGIAPSFYSLRWITTLFTREFDLFDTIRLWDSLFADTDRHDMLCCLCCTMVMEKREELLEGDFTRNLTLLQNYPPVDISYFLSRVDHLRSKDKSKLLNFGERTRDRDWNGAGSTKCEENNEIDASTKHSVGQLMRGLSNSFNDDWLSGVRQSLLNGLNSANNTAAETSVPDFRQCRNSDLKFMQGVADSPSSLVVGVTYERSEINVDDSLPKNSPLTRVNGTVISFGDVNDDTPVTTCPCSPVLTDAEEDDEFEDYLPLWEFGSPIDATDC